MARIERTERTIAVGTRERRAVSVTGSASSQAFARPTMPHPHDPRGLPVAARRAGIGHGDQPQALSDRKAQNTLIVSRVDIAPEHDAVSV